jgi:plasmid stabilization system protein ParE
MSVRVELTNRAASDIAAIRDFLKLLTSAERTTLVIRALLGTAKKLGTPGEHRIGEALDGYDGPPAREVHKNVVLGGAYEHYYEIIPAYAAKPDRIVILRVWDTRQDR